MEFTSFLSLARADRRTTSWNESVIERAVWSTLVFTDFRVVGVAAPPCARSAEVIVREGATGTSLTLVIHRPLPLVRGRAAGRRAPIDDAVRVAAADRPRPPPRRRLRRQDKELEPGQH